MPCPRAIGAGRPLLFVLWQAGGRGIICLAPSRPGMLPGCQPVLAFMPWPRFVSSVVHHPVAPTTLQWSLQMHIRHTADRFRLIAHIEKEPTASSSCTLTHVQRYCKPSISSLLLNALIVPPRMHTYPVSNLSTMMQM